MAVTIRIPTTLRPLSGGASTVSVEGNTLAEVLAALNAIHPGFSDRLFDDAGNLHKFVNVFVSDDDVRYLDGLNTKVPAGETVSIIPAVGAPHFLSSTTLRPFGPKVTRTASANLFMPASRPRRASSSNAIILDIMNLRVVA